MESSVVRREQCPSCNDSGEDNLCIYDDGHKYCHACSYREDATLRDRTSAKIAQVGGVSKMETDKIDHTPEKAGKSDLPLLIGRFDALTKRGITEETCRFFSYKVGEIRGKFVHIAEYKKDGNVIAQKIRTRDKQMWSTGDFKSVDLFGQWCYQPTDKLFITVVEGEIDCMSVAQVQGLQYPVVSVPKGAGDAKKALMKSLKYLMSFKYVILAFDNDEDGRKATEECLTLFEPGRVRVAEWPQKDANDLLVRGEGDKIRNILFNAKDFQPEHLVTVEDIIDDILQQPLRGTEYPWETMTKITYGFQLGELHILVGAPGIGKTEIAKELLYWFLDKEMKVGLFSFEQGAENSLRRIVGSKLGLKLHLPGANWDQDKIRAEAMKLNERIYLCRRTGAIDLDGIFLDIKYLARAKGVQFFIIDNLASLGVSTDFKQAEKLMTTLQALKLELNISIVLLSHVAKDKMSKQVYVSTSPKNAEYYDDQTASDFEQRVNKPGMEWESGRMPTNNNVDGPAIIVRLADYVWGIGRNTTSEDKAESQVTKVKALKTRLDSSMTGIVFNLCYTDKGRLIETSNSSYNQVDYKGDF